MISAPPPLAVPPSVWSERKEEQRTELDNKRTYVRESPEDAASLVTFWSDPPQARERRAVLRLERASGAPAG